MKGISCIKRFFNHSCILMLFIFCTSNSSYSQQFGIPYSDYTKAIGWEEDFIVMKNILKSGLTHRIKDKPEAYYEDNAEFFSMVLLLSGVGPADYYRLDDNGIDVIHAITADVRPFDEQSLLSDLVILGEVVEINPEPLEEDGFNRTIRVQISEVLKGTASVDTIQIRRRDSAGLSGNNILPELNRSYLFLLSSGMYGFHKANHQFRQESEAAVSPPRFGQEEVFLIYRIYPYVNGQLQRSSQNTAAAFSALKMADFIINQQ